METLQDLTRSLVRVLSAAPGFEEAAVSTAFPTDMSTLPALPAVTVGIGSIETDARARPGGEASDAPPVCAQLMQVIFTLDFYGGRGGAALCHRLFTAAAQCLCIEPCPISIKKLWSEGAAADSTTHGILLRARASAIFLFSPDRDKTGYTDIFVRRENG